MLELVSRWLAAVIGLGAAVWVVPGIWLTPGTNGQQLGTLALVAVVLGVVNAVVKPVLQLLSLPFVVLTLGLFLLVVNAAVLGLTAGLAGLLGLGFHVVGLGSALLGGVVISVVTFGVSLLVGDGRR